MKWFKKLRDLGREKAQQPTAKDEARKETLRIEELEERIVPNAIWDED
jgi:hypothetical protein